MWNAIAAGFMLGVAANANKVFSTQELERVPMPLEAHWPRTVFVYRAEAQ
jgi:hypothetical protein